MADPISPNDPKRDAEVMRFYRRHDRRRRWQERCGILIKAAPWAFGLAATTVILNIAYQDHVQLAELYQQGPGKSIELAVPPEALVTAKAADKLTVKPVDPLAAFSNPQFYRDAQNYINGQLASAISSANPPPHRHPR